MKWRVPLSTIWKYYEKNKPNIRRCNICKKEIKVTKGSTTALIRHVQAKHPATYKTYTEDQKLATEERKSKAKAQFPSAVKQSKIENFLNSNEKWSSSHPKVKTNTSTLCKWVATGLHPYSIVEERGICRLNECSPTKLPDS